MTRISATQFRHIIEVAVSNTHEGITIANMRERDAPLVYVNCAFCGITGYDESEVLGRNCRFLQGPKTDPSARDEIRAAILGGKRLVIELVNYRKCGEPFRNRLSLVPIPDLDGRPLYYVGIQSDMDRPLGCFGGA